MTNVLGLMGELSGQSAIVIRHAERFDITCAGDYWTCGLTNTGMDQAAEFGLKIAEHFESYRLFYSPVKRCQETAENIKESMEISGKKVPFIGPEKILGVSYILIDIIDGFHEADKFGKEFIRAWFDGKVDSKIFMPLHETKKEHLAYLQEKFSSSNEGRHLDIHVTHDWNVNVLREGIFDLKHEDIGWPDFLSGLGFSKAPFNAFVNNNGKVTTTSIHPE